MKESGQLNLILQKWDKNPPSKSWGLSEFKPREWRTYFVIIALFSSIAVLVFLF